MPPLEKNHGEVCPSLVKLWEETLNRDLSPQQRLSFVKMLRERKHAFADIMGEKTDGCPLFEASWDIPEDTHPLNQRQYPLKKEGEAAASLEFEKMEKNRVIFRQESDWRQPILLVRKPDGRWRTVIDFRRLNKLIKPISIPIPRIQDTLEALDANSFFSTFNMNDGFHQIRLGETSKHQTAFIHKGIHY